MLTHVVVFIALFAIFNSLAGFIWDFTIKPFPSPFGTAPLLGSGLLSAHQAGMIGVTVLVLGLLYGVLPLSPASAWPCARRPRTRYRRGSSASASAG